MKMQAATASTFLCLILCTAAAKAQDYYGTSVNQPTREELIESLKKEVSALTDKTDEDSKRKLRNVAPYLEMLELDLNNCNPTIFTRYKVWIEDQACKMETNKEAVVNVLRERRRELWQRCRTEIREKLMADISRLTPNQQRMAKGIIGEIKKANRGDSFFSFAAATAGIANYIKHASVFYRVKSERLISAAWRRHIIETCEPVMGDIYNDTYIYRSMDWNIQQGLDQFEKDWLLTGQVCARISDLHDEVYRALG